jgi:AcrR family transcriptional regulator
VAGLRDRKKQAVRRRIIDVADRLFAERGLDATTMDDVAAQADVSVATVYNYFGSKHALLVAGMEDETEAMIEDGGAVLARPGTDPQRAVQRLIGVYLDHLTSWDPALLREVMAASFQRSGGVEMTAELARMDERLIDQLRTLLATFQEQGRLPARVDPGEATLLVSSTMFMQLFVYLALDGVDSSSLRARVNRQIDLAFRGLTGTGDRGRSENERTQKVT